jgi:hypothetical protein
MSDKPLILVQLDTDPLPSVFDRVVAVDSGVGHLFSYGGVRPDNVMPLVHGCIFTRGPKDLHRTAIFVGGSDVAAGSAIERATRKPPAASRRWQISDARRAADPHPAALEPGLPPSNIPCIRLRAPLADRSPAAMSESFTCTSRRAAPRCASGGF